MTENNRPTERELSPRDMRSWHTDKDDHRMEGMEEFKRNTPLGSLERKKCIQDGDYARRKFAEWGHFYLEDEKPPAHFPTFDPTWGITKIPSTTKFRVYEDHGDRPKRDEQVILILPPPQGTFGEHRDPMWRCTYTPYVDSKDGEEETKDDANQ